MNNNSADNTFLDEGIKKKIHIKDILLLILHNIHWLILCGIIGGLIGTYMVRKQDKVYQAHASIMLKNIGSNGRGGSSRFFDQSAALSGYSGSFGRFYANSVQNEILVLKSKTTMAQVVERLGINQFYSTKTKFFKRNVDLYKKSPIEVKLIDATSSTNVSFTVTPMKDSTAVIEIADIAPIKVHLRDTVKTPLGRMVVEPTWYLQASSLNVPVNVRRMDLASAANMFRYALNISYDDRTISVVNLSMRGSSPERAADIINTVIEVYNEDVINDKTRLLDYTTNYINERLELLGSDLGMNQNQIATFKQEHNLVDVASYGQMYMEASIQSNAEVENLMQQLSYDEYMTEQLKSTDGFPPLATSVSIQDNAVSSVITQYNELAFKLAGYENSGAVNNPAVNSLKKQLTGTKNNLINILATYRASLEKRIESAQEQGLIATRKVRQVPGSQIYLDNVERVQSVKEELYKQLLSRREEVMINQPAIEGSAKIIDEASYSYTPVAPDEKQGIMIGIILGLLAPVLVYLLYKVFDTKVKTRRDIQDNLSIPFIGEIPSKPKDDNRQIVFNNHSRDVISEAIRCTRSKIDYIAGSNDSKVFMFTSFFESSGKTFISSNLAVSYAVLGKKVALVDLDLRKGTMGLNIGREKTSGVSNYLAGKIPLESIAVQDPDVPTLYRFFAGPIPPNPAELLASERMNELVEYLRNNFEMVFLDSVPAGIVADADIVKKYADTTIFVIRSGKFDKRMFPDLQNLYDDAIFPNLCLMLNDVDYSKPAYGYGKGYGYAYGYGYGYGRAKGYGYGKSSYYGQHGDKPEKKSRLKNLIEKSWSWLKKLFE